MALSEVPDPVFARGLMGAGVAIRPTSGVLRSPVDGTITSVARARHAVGITSDDGGDILLHVGIDIVHLSGRHFETLITHGQRLRLGTPLILVDLEALRAAGYERSFSGPLAREIVSAVTGTGRSSHRGPARRTAVVMDLPDPHLLALSDVMCTGWHAAVCAGVQPGMSVIVVGDGAVGLSGVLAASQLGATLIISMSRHEDRQQVAMRAGLTNVAMGTRTGPSWL